MRIRYRYLHLLLAVLLGQGLIFVMAGTASAHFSHAKVLSATPGIGSTINQVPGAVTVFTAENLNPDPKKSNLYVYGPDGVLISQGDARVPLTDPKQMSVSIKSDGSGMYVVQWISVSALDGDPDQGAFVFTVKSSAPATSVTATGQTTPQPLNTSGVALWVPIVVGVLALLIGSGGGFGIQRVRTSSKRTTRKAVAAQQQEQEVEALTKRP